MFVNEIILAYLSSLKVSFKGMELPKINSGLVAMNYPLERALLKKNNKQQNIHTTQFCSGELLLETVSFPSWEKVTHYNVESLSFL